MANPVTALREILQLADRIRAEHKAKHPPVYSVESGVDPYGFFHNDVWEYPAKPEPMPMDRTCAGWEKEL